MLTDPLIPREYFEPVFDSLMEKRGVLLFGIILGLIAKIFKQNVLVLLVVLLSIMYSLTIE